MIYSLFRTHKTIVISQSVSIKFCCCSNDFCCPNLFYASLSADIDLCSSSVQRYDGTNNELHIRSSLPLFCSSHCSSLAHILLAEIHSNFIFWHFNHAHCATECCVCVCVCLSTQCCCNHRAT